MRTIEISNEIFGKIWSASVEGDKSENDILARMFAEREFLAEVEAEPEHVETKTIQVKSHYRKDYMDRRRSFGARPYRWQRSLG